MFERVKGFFRKAVNSLLGREEISKVFEIDIPISTTMQQHIAKWDSMYRNDPSWIGCDIVSLNLPALISSEIARGATIEMESECSGSARADFLNGPYQDVIFDARKIVEWGTAVGDVIIRPFVKDGTIGFDYSRAGYHFPTAFDNKGYSTGEIFVDQETLGNKYYTLLSYQRLVDKEFRITNKAFVSENAADIGKESELKSIDKWKDLLPESVVTNVDRPLWGHFKTPFANQIEPGSPFSVSGFSRAVDLIEQANKQFTRMLWEYEGSELAVHADLTTFQKDSRGNFKLPKGRDRLYRMANFDPDSKKGLIDVFSPQIRDESIINGLNEILAKIEDECGVARGTISDRTEGEARTATEIRILRQRTYATIADTQKALREALVQLAYAMDIWVSVFDLAPKGTYELSFYFDDSVITDKDADKQRWLSLAIAGRIPLWYYLSEFEGLSLEEAKLIDLESFKANNNKSDEPEEE